MVFSCAINYSTFFGQGQAAEGSTGDDPQQKTGLNPMKSLIQAALMTRFPNKGSPVVVIVSPHFQMQQGGKARNR